MTVAQDIDMSFAYDLDGTFLVGFIEPDVGCHRIRRIVGVVAASADIVTHEVALFRLNHHLLPFFYKKKTFLVDI